MKRGTLKIEDDPVVTWLLEGEPWVVYRTLADLVGRPQDDSRVVEARAAIAEHPLVAQIFARQNESGYWGTPSDIHTWWPKKDTTFWILSVLADFGLTAHDPRIASACEYVLSTQLPSGGFGWSPPTKAADCHTAILVESLAQLGYLDDPRLEAAYDWLLGRPRRDGGFWCKDTGRIGGPREAEPSCAFATTFVLAALVQDPRLCESAPARHAADFLFGCFRNRGRVKYAGHDSQIGTDWEKLKYPFTDYKILKTLDALSRLSSAAARLRGSEMLSLLLAKRDAEGRYTPESVHAAWSSFDFGQKESASRWMTFLTLRIARRTAPAGKTW